MRVVIDCNVVISAGLSAHPGTCRKAIVKAFDLIRIIESAALKIEDQTIDNIILPDASDVIYLCAARNSKAKYLITGNAKDFPKENCGLVTVVSPGDFLNMHRVERIYV